MRMAWNAEIVLLTALILLRTIVFTALKWFRFRSFFAIEWQDSAASHQIIWHTAHGNWFYQHITGEYFLGHFEPIYLIPAAVYALIEHPITIFAVVSLGISLGAVPIYLWVKRQTGVPRAAIAGATGYLLYAPLGYVNLGDVRGIVLCVAPLLFAVYFFERRRPWLFVGCAVLAMSCKENLTFVVFLMGVLAVLRRRPWPWAVGPMLLGVAWFVFVLKFVMPRVLSGETYSTDTYFNHWGGGTALDIVLGILRDPINHTRLVLCESRRIAALQLAAPLCFLCLLAPDILLLAVPGVMQLALLRNGCFPHIRAHWFTIPSVLLFVAGIYGMTRLLRTDNPLGRRFGTLKRGRVFLPWALASACLLSNAADNTLTQPRLSDPIYDSRFAVLRNMFDPAFYSFDDEDRRLWRIVRRIPGGASVAATAHFLPALAARPKVMEMWTSIRDIHGRPLRYSDCEYLLIDFRNYHHGGGRYRWPKGDELVLRLAGLMSQGGWRAVVEEKTTLLLRKDIGYHMPPREPEAIAKRMMNEWLKVQGHAQHIERAVMAYERGDLRSSKQEYLKAIDDIRPDPYPYSQLCGVCLGLRDFHRAIAYGEVAVRLDPLDSFTWFRIALALQSLREMEVAIRRCKRAIRVYPYEARFRALLAELYHRTGCSKAARRQARIALRIKYDDRDTVRVARMLGILK